MKIATVLLLSALQAMPLDGSWVGRWVLDRSMSHFTGSSLTIVRTGVGYHFDFGATSFDIGDDGNFYSAYGNRSTSLKVVSSRSWFRVHRLNGKEVDHSTITVTADERRMLIDTVSVSGGAQPQEIMNRVGSGKGLAGTWKSTNVGTNVSEIIELSYAGADRLRWDFPREEQYYIVSVNGDPARYAGPHAVSGVTVSVVASSRRRMRWTEFLNGKPYVEASDELSPNGKILTETTWPVQNPSERQVAVYKKR